MKKRQIKKNSKTAMLLLRQISLKDYPEDCFAQDLDHCGGEVKGIWEYWYSCSWECNEWDTRSAFDELVIYLENNLSAGDVSDGLEWIWKYRPDLSTAKKVFNLAKQLVTNGGVA